MDQPLVSIVTPSYNYGQYLDACLQSVQRQIYPNVEHIVLDACSSDSTPGVLAKHSGRSNLTIVVEKDQGQADAINKGFARARGDILCWLNADDYYLHDRVIEEVVALYRRFPQADVVTGAGYLVDEAGRWLEPVWLDPRELVSGLPYYDTILQPATFWRRRVHRPLRTGMSYAFDWALFLEMRRDRANFLGAARFWAGYRMHGVNKTALDPAERRAELASVLAETWGRLSPQYLWAAGVRDLFRLSEAVRLPALKWAALRANGLVCRLTRHRVSA